MYILEGVCYLTFDPFIDMKEEWSKVLLDKAGSLFCVCEFQVCCHLS